LLAFAELEESLLDALEEILPCSNCPGFYRFVRSTWGMMMQNTPKPKKEDAERARLSELRQDFEIAVSRLVGPSYNFDDDLPF